MIRFPLNDRVMLAIIEPGNIDRLKAGHPLKIEYNGFEFIVVCTPDMAALCHKLGIIDPIHAKDIGIIQEECSITAHDIAAELEACKNLPEVHR